MDERLSARDLSAIGTELAVARGEVNGFIKAASCRTGADRQDMLAVLQARRDRLDTEFMNRLDASLDELRARGEELNGARL